MPKCEPVQCDILDYTGQTKTVDSYGKRKRRNTSNNPTNLMSLLTHTSNVRQRRNTEPEEVLVVQTLRIVDRYGKRKELPKVQVNNASHWAIIFHPIVPDFLLLDLSVVQILLGLINC